MIRGKKIHCVGVGGIGLSALTQLLKSFGNEVSGCDSATTPWLLHLREEGLEILEGHNKNHVEGKNLVVATLALPKDHPELLEAKKQNIQTLTYPQALGEITKAHSTIAICGSHGKTTITAMISKILIENGFDPTIILGSTSSDLGGKNFRKGKGKWMVIEACEYERAFLEYTPHHLIITNLDHDHFDTYPKQKDYFEAFYVFAKKVPRNGLVVGNTDDPLVAKLFEKLREEGVPEKNLVPVAVSANHIPFDLKIPGNHNRQNALLAYSLAEKMGLHSDDILYSLNRYEGTGRRLEEKGIIRNVRLIDDYAHHPTEIRASIQALREKYPNEKIWIVYQPHQFIRTKALLTEFGAAFRGVERVIVPNIYDARDFGTKGSITVDDLVSTIAKDFSNVMNGQGFDQTAQYLKAHWSEFTILVTMGAGDVWKIQKKL